MPASSRGRNSSRVSPAPLLANEPFELVEERAIAVRDGIDERGKNRDWLAVLTMKQTAHELGRDGTLDFLPRRGGPIHEGAAGLAARQQPLLEQAIHRRHHGGVGDLAAEPIARVADADLAAVPDNRHHVALERAEALLEEIARRFEAPEQEPAHADTKRRAAADAVSIR